MSAKFSGINCPRCNSGRTIHIIYGDPNKETEEMANRGDIELGGCTWSDDSPNHFCTKCGKRFKV